MEKISLKNFAYIPVNHTSSNATNEAESKNSVPEKTPSLPIPTAGMESDQDKNTPPFNEVFQALIIRNAAGDTVYLPHYAKKKEANFVPMMYRITSRLDIHQ